VGKRYDELVARHVTYEEFEAACRRALGEISAAEYETACRRYAWELEEARRHDGGPAFSPITLTVFEDPAAWLRQHVPDMRVDSVAGVQRISKFDPDGLTAYEDFEEQTKKDCDLAAHVWALQLLCEQVGRTLFVGGIKSPLELLDPGNWDVEVVDAYYQLVYYGKVLYG
jgi:hypothetical protein